MKKLFVTVLALAITFILCWIWWIVPTRIINIDPQSVSKIEIFNGNRGKEIVITEKSEIEHIINNLKSITLKRERISLGYMGFSFRTTIYKNDTEVIKTFIINSDDTIRKDPFFYKDSSRSIDYNFIERLFAKEQSGL